MRYKRGISVIAHDGNIVTFNAEERSKLLLTYVVCQSCKNKWRTDIIAELHVFKNPGFFEWICSKCNKVTSLDNEMSKYARNKVNDLTREDPIIVHKLK